MKAKLKNEDVVAAIRENIAEAKGVLDQKHDRQQRRIAFTIMRRLALGKFKYQREGSMAGWLKVTFWAWADPDDELLSTMLSDSGIAVIKQYSQWGEPTGFNIRVGWHTRFILYKTADWTKTENARTDDRPEPSVGRSFFIPEPPPPPHDPGYTLISRG